MVGVKSTGVGWLPCHTVHPPATARIAFIVAFGVLLDTFIVRTLLVPALAIDMGAFTWWPIRPRPTKSQLAHRGPSKVMTRV